MAKVLGIIGLCCLVAPMSAMAKDTHSANYLLEGCRVVANGGTPTNGLMFQATMCMGELQAIKFFASSINSSLRACPPREADVFQVAKVVVAYLDKNPARLHDVFLGLAYTAVAEAWPCN
ncbi:hypothetical protein SAMN05444161_7513 [Rhizobiales bacterium GAS191]|nr:hypothetical protein SAMN05444161_7513 [Rhizobiales bacterium GAS191]